MFDIQVACNLWCVCGTWEGFGAWFGGKASCPDHLNLQLAFLIHQTDLNITCLYRRHMQTRLDTLQKKNCGVRDVRRCRHSPMAGVASVCRPTS